MILESMSSVLGICSSLVFFFLLAVLPVFPSSRTPKISYHGYTDQFIQANNYAMEWLQWKHSLCVSWEEFIEEMQLDYGYEEIPDFVKIIFKD